MGNTSSTFCSKEPIRLVIIYRWHHSRTKKRIDSYVVLENSHIDKHICVRVLIFVNMGSNSNTQTNTSFASILVHFAVNLAQWMMKGLEKDGNVGNHHSFFVKFLQEN